MNSKTRSNIRFEDAIYKQINILKDNRGFDTFIETTKFLIRFAELSTRRWSIEDLPVLTYKNRIEQTITFHPNLLVLIDTYHINVEESLSRNDRINYLCYIGLKEYAKLLQVREGDECDKK
ncbi:hypothetical protein ACIQYL_20785 [Lysinibacillus xylanilyticus]|uniref:hypothetical protein n=1 Tax=Lysinibacillus xylanilyticus TaxID=582475 RepID=UPI003816D006